MFPLSDPEPNRYEESAWMTMTLILVNALVFVFEMYAKNSEYAFLDIIFRYFGFTPAWVYSQQGGGALMAITSTFLHGNFYHLLGNMLYLWVFGRRVEDACGPWRFLIFYLTCGAAANFTTAVVEYNNISPHIGASGAIAGVLGAYYLLYPGSRIRVLILLVVVPIFPRIRAGWLLLAWVAIFQIPPALVVLLEGGPVTVGYWAHLGGFFSAIFVFLFIRPEVFRRLVNGLPVS